MQTYHLPQVLGDHEVAPEPLVTVLAILGGVDGDLLVVACWAPADVLNSARDWLQVGERDFCLDRHDGVQCIVKGVLGLDL